MSFSVATLRLRVLEVGKLLARRGGALAIFGVVVVVVVVVDDDAADGILWVRWWL